MPNIGRLALANNLITAPLAGISDYPFRQLARDFGIGFSYTEMISATGVFRGDKKSRTFTFVNGEHPVAAQIFGSDPAHMAYAAKYFQDQGADAIDINLGCPVKKVLKQGAGSALQRDFNQTKKVISAVRQAITIPLLIKTRLGWNKAEENYLDIAAFSSDQGVDAFCLHPRYATQMFSGVADWTKFSKLCKKFPKTIIGSGDINTLEKIRHVEANYPVDFIMLGRGLMGNPWLISEALNLPKKSLPDTLQTHFSYLVNFHGEIKASRHIRKFISKYIKGHPLAAELRQKGNKLTSKKDFQAFLALLTQYR